MMNLRSICRVINSTIFWYAHVLRLYEVIFRVIPIDVIIVV